MIIAHLVGGLANQMCIYAAARNLSLKHDVPLRLDVSHYVDDPLRQYELDKLGISGQVITKREMDAFWGMYTARPLRKLRKSLCKRLSFIAPLEYREKQLAFDPYFLELPARLFLSGNFASVRYYQPIRHLLLEEFKVVAAIQEASLNWSRKICATNAVALHVRRTDYAHNQVTNQYHGLLGMDYYRDAIDYIKKQESDLTFYVFSDDPEWARHNIKMEQPCEYVDCNDAANGYQDFYLMQQCKHHIIANSGFSRWAAYLCQSPGKVVCTPARWNQMNSLPDVDMAPMEWVRIPNSFA